MAKTKAHFKLHTSIASHRNTAMTWVKLEDRAIYAELGRLSIVKYAAKTNDTFWISSAELMGVTCCQSPSAAASRVRAWVRRGEAGAKSLGGDFPVTIEQVGVGWRVTIRNLRKKQGFESPIGPITEPPEAETEAETETKTKAEKNSSPSDDAVACAEYLKRTVLAIQPGRQTPKSLTSWSRTYDKLLRVNGRTREKVFVQLDWLASPDNQDQGRFATTVFSADAHHKKFDDIALRMKHPASGKPKPIPTTPGVGQWKNG